jgi:hypothetical protein
MNFLAIFPGKEVEGERMGKGGRERGQEEEAYLAVCAPSRRHLDRARHSFVSYCLCVPTPLPPGPCQCFTHYFRFVLCKRAGQGTRAQTANRKPQTDSEWGDAADVTDLEFMSGYQKLHRGVELAPRSS